LAPPKKSKNFDSEEESALKIDPRLIVAICIAIVLVVEILAFLTSTYEWW
jgi:preprotein translocase subunit Sec61beta